jgi:site-specific recombinase XerD
LKSAPSLAPLLQGFFTNRLIAQKQVSPHTITSYRDTFRLVLKFLSKRLRRSPSSILLEEVEAPVIVAFLDELEKQRGSGA